MNLRTGIPQTWYRGAFSDKDWIRKEVASVIRMTTEFLKDMDMKMRDVRRVERYYYGAKDFGAGRIFSAIQSKFDHMCLLYKNTSVTTRILGDWGKYKLRENVVGSLQFMLSDYMEMLGLIDLFKVRYSYWRQNSDRDQLRDLVMRFLLLHDVKPTNYEEMEDSWRRAGVSVARAPVNEANRSNSDAYYSVLGTLGNWDD